MFSGWLLDKISNMLYNECMEEVLKFGKYSVQAPNIEEILKDAVQRGFYDNYTNNAHNDGNVNNDDLEKFCRRLYKFWYEQIKGIYDHPELTQESKEIFAKVMENPDLSVESMKSRSASAYDFFVKDYKDFGIDSRIRPLDPQSNRDMNAFKNGASDFIHIFHNGHIGGGRDKIDCRLYMNFKSDKVLDFINEFIAKSVKVGGRMPYLKFYTTTNNRNDNFMIYTSYEKAEQWIDMIEQIKKEKPELFEGAEKVSRNFGKINGYIGYGDEPTEEQKKIGSSYNALRDEIVSDFAYANKNQKYSTEMKQMFEQKLEKHGIEPNFCVSTGTRERVEEIYKKKEQGKPRNEKLDAKIAELEELIKTIEQETKEFELATREDMTKVYEKIIADNEREANEISQ